MSGGGTGPARHLDALTGIRGVAAWLVVLYHIRLSLTAILPGWTIAAMGKGYLAVDLFFMLSGFVIWYNYAQRIAQGGAGEVRQFLWRRFARVWPLHGAILAGFMGLALLLALTGRSTAGYPWGELPLHVLLLQNWGFTTDLTWNHPAWSISTELAAYLVFPALVALGQRVPLGPKALSLAAAALALAVHALFATRGHGQLGADIPHLGLWRCLIEFAMGCLLCRLWQAWWGRPRAALLGWCAFAGWGLTAAALTLPETALVPPLFFTGLLALALDRGPVTRLFGTRPVLYLGEISYSTYLAHFGLFILFKLAFVDASLQLGWRGLAGFLALVFVTSAALYHGLEKAAQRWLNRHPPRRRVAPESIPAE